MTSFDRSLLSEQAPAAAREQAMIAHDLRGALHGVVGGVSMLGRAPLDAQAREQVERIAAAARNLACLVNRLLGEEPTPEQREAHAATDVARFLRHVGRRWTGEAEERGLRFLIDAGPDLPAVLRVELGVLVRALGNLIGNALRYAWSGDVRLNVRRTPGGGLAFEVLDDGPSLASGPIDDESGSGRPCSSSAEGAGLGLHVARNLCAGIGGEFRLANRASGGVEAALIFPPALCAESLAPPPEAVGVGAFDLGGLRVLLAEDNAANRLLTGQMLRAHGLTVTSVSDGAEALEVFERSAFDLIVVDIEMPRVTGIEVIRAIRARGDGRADVPIVALTAVTMGEQRGRIAAAGANGLLSKPVASLETLGAALRAHIAPAAGRPPVTEEPDAPAADAPVADLAAFEALSAAIGAEMMEELLEKVVADLASARRDLSGALDPLERGAIRSASHILISVAGAVGATRLENCARALNVAAHDENARGLAGDLRRCVDEIDAALAFANSRRAAGRGGADAG